MNAYWKAATERDIIANSADRIGRPDVAEDARRDAAQYRKIAAAIDAKHGTG